MIWYQKRCEIIYDIILLIWQKEKIQKGLGYLGVGKFYGPDGLDPFSKLQKRMLLRPAGPPKSKATFLTFLQAGGTIDAEIMKQWAEQKLLKSDKFRNH